MNIYALENSVVKKLNLFNTPSLPHAKNTFGFRLDHFSFSLLTVALAGLEWKQAQKILSYGLRN